MALVGCGARLLGANDMMSSMLEVPILRTRPVAPLSEADALQGTDYAPAATEGAGGNLAATYACVACHSPNGIDGAGPTWLGLAGSERVMEDGEVVVADRDYLIRSIVDPGAHVVRGFFDAMPRDLRAAFHG
jgi:mono/diheme cytochrome c family protein